jgi:hypothetical protein
MGRATIAWTHAGGSSRLGSGGRYARSREATWRSGYAAACKAVYTGSIPVVAFTEPPANAGTSQLGATYE